MKVKLILEDWKRDGLTLEGTEEIVKYKLSGLVPGSFIEAELDLDKDEEIILKEAVSTGVVAHFKVVLDN